MWPSFPLHFGVQIFHSKNFQGLAVQVIIKMSMQNLSIFERLGNGTG